MISLVRSICVSTLCLLLWAGAAPADAADAIVDDYGLTRVTTSIAEDAVIDWNDPGDIDPDLERQFIATIFDGGATDGASSTLLGARPAELRIVVTQFDILSTLELFFCCAVNEVSAFYELVDATTGEVLAPRRLINFDHIGRGGLIGAVASSEGNGQIQRLIGIIRDETAEWIAESSAEAAATGG